MKRERRNYMEEYSVNLYPDESISQDVLSSMQRVLKAFYVPCRSWKVDVIGADIDPTEFRFEISYYDDELRYDTVTSDYRYSRGSWVEEFGVNSNGDIRWIPSKSSQMLKTILGLPIYDERMWNAAEIAAIEDIKTAFTELYSKPFWEHTKRTASIHLRDGDRETAQAYLDGLSSTIRGAQEDLTIFDAILTNVDDPTRITHPMVKSIFDEVMKTRIQNNMPTGVDDWRARKEYPYIMRYYGIPEADIERGRNYLKEHYLGYAWVWHEYFSDKLENHFREANNNYDYHESEEFADFVRNHTKLANQEYSGYSWYDEILEDLNLIS